MHVAADGTERGPVLRLAARGARSAIARTFRPAVVRIIYRDRAGNS
jgi:hypothetical protein